LPLESMSERPSVNAAPPSYEEIHPIGLATPNALRKVKRPIDSPSYPQYHQSLKSVSIAGASPPESKHSRNISDTSSSGRESSPSRRPGDMDVNLNAYPIKDELPGYHAPCVSDSGGLSVDGKGGASSGFKLGDIDVGGGNFNVGDCGLQ
jgi:hypothetical protein